MTFGTRYRPRSVCGATCWKSSLWSDSDTSSGRNRKTASCGCVNGSTPSVSAACIVFNQLKYLIELPERLFTFCFRQGELGQRGKTLHIFKIQRHSEFRRVTRWQTRRWDRKFTLSSTTGLPHRPFRLDFKRSLARSKPSSANSHPCLCTAV